MKELDNLISILDFTSLDDSLEEEYSLTALSKCFDEYIWDWLRLNRTQVLISNLESSDNTIYYNDGNLIRTVRGGLHSEEGTFTKDFRIVLAYVMEKSINCYVFLLSRLINTTKSNKEDKMNISPELIEEISNLYTKSGLLEVNETDCIYDNGDNSIDLIQLNESTINRLGLIPIHEYNRILPKSCDIFEGKSLTYFIKVITEKLMFNKSSYITLYNEEHDCWIPYFTPAFISSAMWITCFWSKKMLNKESSTKKEETLQWIKLEEYDTPKKGVYCFYTDKGLKIGKSSNINNRIKSHIATNMTYSSSDIGDVYYALCENISYQESRLHKRFEKFRLAKEVFDIDIETLIEESH